MNECFVHLISVILFTFHAQRDTLTYTKLEWVFYRIFCSHSVHKMMLRRIQNLNDAAVDSLNWANVSAQYDHDIIALYIAIGNHIEP